MSQTSMKASACYCNSIPRVSLCAHLPGGFRKREKRKDKSGREADVWLQHLKQQRRTLRVETNRELKNVIYPCIHIEMNQCDVYGGVVIVTISSNTVRPNSKSRMKHFLFSSCAKQKQSWVENKQFGVIILIQLMFANNEESLLILLICW